jgi:micrococcal nuclease
MAQTTQINIYFYKVKNYKVVDGDTIKVTLDLGFNINLDISLRLKNVYAPESRSSNTTEKELGLKVKTFLESTVQKYSSSLYVSTEKDPSTYDRYVGTLYYQYNSNNFVSINDIINQYMKESLNIEGGGRGYKKA